MKKCLAIALAACAGICLCAADPGHWNGGRTVPVHRLAPLDFDGEKVSPSASLPSPISPGFQLTPFALRLSAGANTFHLPSSTKRNGFSRIASVASTSVVAPPALQLETPFAPFSGADDE